MTAVYNRAKQVLAKPVLPLRQLLHCQAELRYWQLEVDFFHKLLSIGILNCKTCERSTLDDLLSEFARYKDEILPHLKVSLEEVLSGVPEFNGLRSTTLLEDFRQQDENLKKLKMEVFPRVWTLFKITIW